MNLRLTDQNSHIKLQFEQNVESIKEYIVNYTMISIEGISSSAYSYKIIT